MASCSSFCSSIGGIWPGRGEETALFLDSLRSLWSRDVLWKREVDYPVLLPQDTPIKSIEEIRRWFFDPEFAEERAKIEKITVTNHLAFSLVPSEIGSLKNLKVFSAVQTSLMKIEDGSLDECGQLEEIELRYGKLAKLSDCFWNRMVTLKALHLTYQGLKKLPKSFQNLKNLQKLDLSGNDLRLFPSPLRSLKKLQALIISGGYSQVEGFLETLPDWLGELESLYHLDLSANRLKTVSDSIGDLKRLSYLDLSANFLVSLPSSIGKLENLRMMNLSGNRLHDLPSISRLKKLESLNVFDNQLNILNPSVWACTSLTYLNVSENSIVGIAKHSVREVIEKNRGKFIF